MEVVDFGNVLRTDTVTIKLLTVARLSAALLARSALNMVVVGVAKCGMSTGSTKNDGRDKYCNPNVMEE